MVGSYALRPAWTPLTIVLMVIGFMIFWPLGLIMLGYIIWGERVPEIRRHFDGMRRGWSHEFRGWGCGSSKRSSHGGYARSGNSAFDDYRERELKRLDEERRKLEEERAEFEAYVHNLRRARDQDEFDRFRSQRANSRKGGETIDL
jgi:hypothetical protein